MASFFHVYRRLIVIKTGFSFSIVFLYFLSPETKPTPHGGIGSVLTQIVLCKSMKPDFNAEEKVSIEKDKRELRQIISDMAECLPKEDPDKGEKEYSWRREQSLMKDILFCKVYNNERRACTQYTSKGNFKSKLHRWISQEQDLVNLPNKD